MTTNETIRILGRMGNLEDRARRLTEQLTGNSRTGQVEDTFRGYAVSVRYTWSRSKSGRGLERWTWYLDGNRINSNALINILEHQPK